MQGLWAVSYIALWVMLLVEAFAIAALLRQISLLNLRVRPVGARTMNMGPEIGSQLPVLRATDILGRVTNIVDHERARLLLFVSPTCSACEDLLPGAKTIARTEKELLDVLLITPVEDPALNRNYVEKHGLTVPYVSSQEVADQIGVAGVPYAVAVDDNGVVRAKGLANHIEHLESLVEALKSGFPTHESRMRASQGENGHGQQP